MTTHFVEPVAGAFVVHRRYFGELHRIELLTVGLVCMASIGFDIAFVVGWNR